MKITCFLPLFIKSDNSVILLVENKVLVFHAFLSYPSFDQQRMVLIIRSERTVGKVQKVYRAITSLFISKILIRITLSEISRLCSPMLFTLEESSSDHHFSIYSSLNFSLS